MEKEVAEKRDLKERELNEAKATKYREMKISQKYAQRWKQEASFRKTLRSAVKLQDAVNCLLFEQVTQGDILKLFNARKRIGQGAGNETKKVQKKKNQEPDGEDIFRSFLISPRNEKAFLLLTSTHTKADSVLGTGSFKQVKRCFDMDTSEMLIVATSSKRKITEPNVEARWAQASSFASREADFLQEFIGDKEIVQLHGKHKTNDKYQLILEFCDEDLESYIQHLIDNPDDGNAEEELDIIEDIIVGVRKIHAKGIIHRDLKPANIFLKDDRAKIADFGLACLESDTAARSMGAGTPDYFSPEFEHAARGPRGNPTAFDRAISNATTYKFDAWAVGLILYQLLTREPKAHFKRYSQSEINESILFYIPADFRALLTGLLQIRPEKRLSLEEAETKIKSIKAARQADSSSSSDSE